MPTATQEQALRAPQTIGVTCPEFASGRQIPREFTGHGDDVSPPLRFSGIPGDAQALALVVDDPDAPRGTFTHWLVWNLRPDTRELIAGVDVRSVGAVEGQNDFGVSRYNGPMPPSGTHRYRFRVFALGKVLGLPENAPASEVWRHLAHNTVAWGELTGTFTKP